ncbi:hypothetical protein AB205_0120390 [Aquarana catesbeiana]|uniref:Uncharacterized protein n=1 Tax=Aquarana catesbeiana TaxID=8400 RepID=A0A2G9RNL0_AQUCT|nr:hypothetical protein AB205_0120390 [Aquarana catesbeiana]
MKAISTQFGHSNVCYCLQIFNVELCKFLSCVLFYGFKHACLTQKRLSVLSKPKMLLQKYFSLFQYPFLTHM